MRKSAIAAPRVLPRDLRYVPVPTGFEGALRACDDELLPCPEDRSGRHWVRVELSTILIKYAFKIAIEVLSEAG